MDIKVVRSVHLYSGCFFTPLLVFFLLSGLWQTFDLHEQKKNSSYKPPQVIEALSQVHKHQRYDSESKRSKPSAMFRILIILMTLGLVLNLVMGLILAFKFGHAAVVWTTFALGILVPILILYLPWLHKSTG